MLQNYSHHANLRKAGETPNGSLHFAKTADNPLFALSLGGVVSYHNTLDEAKKQYEAKGYRPCSPNGEVFADPIAELKYNLRPRANRKG